ncbi:MAG: hypothetical protein FWG47_08715 [Propionibacteriaceae bacterium]|nr:hypothetical protein [Propionibacteriaceae bacterium]
MNQRRTDAARLAELAASSQRAESAAAQGLIADFVAELKARQVAPTPLRAHTLTGRSVKTDRLGWYLNMAKSVAIGEDGSYYLLIVPATWRTRFFGAAIQPSAPPLIVGRGGRDGEGGELRVLLAAALEAYAPNPPHATQPDTGTV